MSAAHPGSPSHEDFAYAAGIVDGEGCIRVHVDKRCNTFNPVVVIEMSELATIQWFSDVFAGRKVQAPRTRQSHHRQTYRWELRGAAALEFLTAILPWLKGKKDQATKLLSWPAPTFKPGWKHPLPHEVKTERYVIYRALQEMKRGQATSGI